MWSVGVDFCVVRGLGVSGEWLLSEKSTQIYSLSTDDLKEWNFLVAILLHLLA